MTTPRRDWVLPGWARCRDLRLAHVARVESLMMNWAIALGLPPSEADAWRDAARWHDLLRDAAPGELRPPPEDPTIPEWAWHGPAAAARLAADGERRADVLDAIRWHTMGTANWCAAGRALYCADFLEPGRRYHTPEHATLAAEYPLASDKVLRAVARARLDKARAGRDPVHPRTDAFWRAIQ